MAGGKASCSATAAASVTIAPGSAAAGRRRRKDSRYTTGAARHAPTKALVPPASQWTPTAWSDDSTAGAGAAGADRVRAGAERRATPATPTPPMTLSTPAFVNASPRPPAQRTTTSAAPAPAATSSTQRTAPRAGGGASVGVQTPALGPASGSPLDAMRHPGYSAAP